MARRELIIPIGTVIQPLPYSNIPQFPGIFPAAGGVGPGFPGAPGFPSPFGPPGYPFEPFPSPYGPFGGFGLPQLPGFLGGGNAWGTGGPSLTGGLGNIMPGGDINVGGGIAQNIAGGLIGGITQEMIGNTPGGAAKIQNVVVPPMTAIGVPFTIQVFFTNTSNQAFQFAGVLNVQGLGIDMQTLSGIQVQPGQAGQVAQNMTIPASFTAGPNYPGSVQIIHYNQNGGQVLDDQATFTIPAPMAVATTVDAVVTANGVMMPSMMAMTGTPSTVTPDTMMAATSGASPTLPATPGVGIVPMNTMTAMSPEWNPNDPMHKRHGMTDMDRRKHRGRIKRLQQQIMNLQNNTMLDSNTKNMLLMQLQADLMMLQKLTSTSWQGGMLVDGKWVPNMPGMTSSTTMMTDELGQTTTTMTSTSTSTPMTTTMNPLQNNNMDFGNRQDWGNLNRINQLPINSAQTQVPMIPAMPTAPNVMAMGPAPWMNNANNMWWNMPWNNQQFMWNGMPMQMQRTGSFQFMPWTNPNTGMPGTFAMPMMQPQPMGFMVQGAMLAKDIENTPSVMDGEDSTPFNDELDIMLLGRNRDRERAYEVPMPYLPGSLDCVACGDHNSWAVIGLDEPDTGSGDDVPSILRGYNFCPNERIKISWHVVLYGGYDVDGQVFRGDDSVMCDHTGRFIYHPRFNELPDYVNGEGLVSAHGTTSRKHANCTIGIS